MYIRKNGPIIAQLKGVQGVLVGGDSSAKMKWFGMGSSIILLDIYVRSARASSINTHDRIISRGGFVRAFSVFFLEIPIEKLTE